MKYIRTKDGIYKSKRECVEKDCLVIGEKENGEIGFVRKDIIKQADTVKELCDGYVIVPNTPYGIPFTRRIDDFEFLQPLDKEVIEAIYGFIRTDKGLIYVAKMNEKGVLELL